MMNRQLQVLAQFCGYATARIAERTTEAEWLRATYTKLQGKLTKTQAQCKMLIAQQWQAGRGWLRHVAQSPVSVSDADALI
jgi:hypothetical protein